MSATEDHLDEWIGLTTTIGVERLLQYWGQTNLTLATVRLTTSDFTTVSGPKGKLSAVSPSPIHFRASICLRPPGPDLIPKQQLET
jgi:hypothetical protein